MEREESSQDQTPSSGTGSPSGTGGQGDKNRDTLAIELIDAAPSTGRADGLSEDDLPPPPQPLKELVRIFLDQKFKEESLLASHIANDDLSTIGQGQGDADDRFVADLRALGRARQYLRHLGLPYASTDVLLANAKSKAKVTKVPATGQRGWLNSLGASSCMYLVTFFLGKWLTATTGIGLVFTGPAGNVALSALVNALVVPLTQAAAGDPMGAALRNFGPNVASEDARQYAAFMTAHALHMRALIGRAHPALAPKFAMEMDRAINAVVWREQGRPGTVTGKPLPIASGVDPIIDPAQAKDAVDAALMASPYTRTQRYKVVSCMLARILLSDELPVHTFTLLNGVTGYLNTLWPAMFGLSSGGQAISRVVDAAAHTGAGFFAMYFMFLLQDLLRPMVQGVGPSDPTDEAYRNDQLEPLLLEHSQDGSRLANAFMVQEALMKLEGRLKKALRAKDLPEGVARSRLGELLTQCRDLCRQYEELRDDVHKHRDGVEEDIRALTSCTGAMARTLLETGRVMSGRTGRVSGPMWTDGTPSVVRGVSKYLGYVTALVPATVMSIATSRAIGASVEAAKVLAANAANVASGANTGVSAGGVGPAAQAWYADAPKYWIQPVQPDEVNLTQEQIADAMKPHAAASGTTAMVAILGWNLRNVLFDPLYQHVLHGGIGVVERLAASCAPVPIPLGAPAATVTTVVPSGLQEGEPQVPPEGHTTSSVSDTLVRSEGESSLPEDQGLATSPALLDGLNKLAQELADMTGSVSDEVNAELETELGNIAGVDAKTTADPSHSSSDRS